MFRSYDKFNERDRRAIRNWYTGIFVSYGAALLLIALIVARHAVDGRATNAARSDQAGVTLVKGWR